MVVVSLAHGGTGVAAVPTGQVSPFALSLSVAFRLVSSCLSFSSLSAGATRRPSSDGAAGEVLGGEGLLASGERRGLEKGPGGVGSAVVATGVGGGDATGAAVSPEKLKSFMTVAKVLGQEEALSAFSHCFSPEEAVVAQELLVSFTSIVASYTEEEDAAGEDTGELPPEVVTAAETMIKLLGQGAREQIIRVLPEGVSPGRAVALVDSLLQEQAPSSTSCCSDLDQGTADTITRRAFGDFDRRQLEALETVAFVLTDPLPALSMASRLPFVIAGDEPCSTVAPPPDGNYPVVLAYESIQLGHGLEALEPDRLPVWHQRFNGRMPLSSGAVVRVMVETQAGIRPAETFIFIAALVFVDVDVGAESLPLVTSPGWQHRVWMLLRELDEVGPFPKLKVASLAHLEERCGMAPLTITQAALTEATERAMGTWSNFVEPSPARTGGWDKAS